ncbi:hypothetical protein NQZ79_g2258 [Umbelopsis isabellina]|nr:hypothetical protein NQZ79_g2258 [Umbelopsis isabellina]
MVQTTDSGKIFQLTRTPLVHQVATGAWHEKDKIWGWPDLTFSLVNANSSTIVPIVTVVGYSRVVNAESAMSHPQRFISSSGDKEALELVRSEWKIRNHGIGLRDVSSRRRITALST